MVGLRPSAGTVSAMGYRPYVAGPFRWRLGLRPLDERDWLEVDSADTEAQMAEKYRVLADHHPTAVAVLDDVVEESTEIREAIVAHLGAIFPEHLARYRAKTGEAAAGVAGAGVAGAGVAGAGVAGAGEAGPGVAGAGTERPDAMHPLEEAARLVTEDLAILVERDGRLVFGGGVVCFPNRWDLRSKLGLPLDAVHAPVARLNAQLADPIDRFFERLTPDRGYWRLGWGVLDTAELYQAVDGTAAPRPGAAVALDDVHVRVERETLRRFGRTGVVLFTIRTHLTPLAEIRSDPAHAALLAEAVAALPDDVAGYKQLDDLGRRVVDWLAG